MLSLNVAPEEWFDEQNDKFEYGKRYTLKLEHSLISISKWESRWKKPYFNYQMTNEESLDYVRCMTVNSVPDDVYERLTAQDYSTIWEYVDTDLTASPISLKPAKGGPVETCSSELVYYWMILYKVPFECEKWHLSRLLKLIEICGVKSTPPEKRPLREIVEERRELNEARKKQLNTRG